MSERENTQSIIGCSSGAWFPDYALGNSIFVYTVGDNNILLCKNDCNVA